MKKFVKKFFQEFREFALRGNVIDLAVGVIIGGAFNAIVRSLSTDILTPPLQLLRPGNLADLFIVLRKGSTPPPYPSLAVAKEAGAVTLNIGSFLDAVVSFLITALAMFVIVRAINAAKRREREAQPAAPTTKKCPYCLSEVPIAATRCAYCTSDLPLEEAPKA